MVMSFTGVVWMAETGEEAYANVEVPWATLQGKYAIEGRRLRKGYGGREEP